MSAPEGTMFGNYRIARPIGTGGFSTVYLAHDDRLDAEVAVKVLAENRALDIDARRRFVEEAQKLRKVQSNEVVTVYDVGETAGKQPYMVLEYADRGDLAGRQRALTAPVTKDGWVQLIDFLHKSLSALHGVGLVHRDVKPHNILIRTSHGASRANTSLLAGNERLLLGDLGFVKDLTMASGLTVGGGTWAYQAPEQRKHMSSVDARADIFSASAVIAWLMIGQHPADGEEWHEMLSRAAISPRIKAELFTGMAESPNNRHGSIDLWHTALLAALQPPISPQAPAPNPARHQTAVYETAMSQTAMPQTATSGPSGGATQVMSGPGQSSGKLGPDATSADGRRIQPRRSLAKRLVAAALLVVGLGGFVGGWILGGPDEPKRQVTVDGLVRTAADANGSSIAIIGPGEVEVGQPETFRSDIPANASGTWIYPDGSLIEAGSGVVYTADSEGVFDVTLVVVVAGSEPELLIHKVRAIE